MKLNIFNNFRAIYYNTLANFYLCFNTVVPYYDDVILSLSITSFKNILNNNNLCLRTVKQNRLVQLLYSLNDKDNLILDDDGFIIIDYKQNNVYFENAEFSDNTDTDVDNADAIKNTNVCDVTDNVDVIENTEVSDNVDVVENTEVSDNVDVVENTEVSDNVDVIENTEVSDNVDVVENTEVSDNVDVIENTEVTDNVDVIENTEVSDNVDVIENTEVCEVTDIPEVTETDDNIDITKDLIYNILDKKNN